MAAKDPTTELFKGCFLLVLGLLVVGLGLSIMAVAIAFLAS